MYNINLKVLTTINGPARRNGRVVVTLEYIMKTGEVKTLSLSGIDYDTTQNRLTLQGITEALKRLNKNCNVAIQTYCDYIANMIENGLPQQWESNGWKTAQGEEVKNADLWQQLATQMKQHNITVQRIKYEPAMDVKFKVIEEADGYKIGDPVEYSCPKSDGKTASGSGKIYGFGRTEHQLIIYVKHEDGSIESATSEYIKRLEEK